MNKKILILLTVAILSIVQVSALNLNTYWDTNEDTAQIDPGQDATYYIDAIPNSWGETLDVEVTLYDNTGELENKGVIYQENNVDAGNFYYSPELTVTENNYELSGDYFLDIKVTQQNNDGTETVRSNQLYLTVTGERNLDADFTFSPQNPTEDDTITFTSTSTTEGNTITDYEWTINGEQTSAQEEFQTQLNEGTYDVSLTITDSAGQTDTETKTVTVEGTTDPEEGPKADFKFSPNNPETGEDVTFTSTSQEGTSNIEFHQWSVDGQLMRVGNPATLSFDEPGTYNVELRVIDENDLEDTITKQITVEEATQPTGPTASFEFSPTNPETNEDVTFTSTSTPGDTPITSYDWNINGESLTGEEVTNTFSEPGTYSASLTVTDQNNVQDTIKKQVHVQEAPEGPNADFEFNPENPVTGEDVIFTSTSREGSSTINTYDWAIDGETLTGEEVTKTFNEAGTKTATLTVTDQNNLQDSTTKQVTIQEPEPTQELRLAELGVNNNVIQTKKQHFIGQVVDQNNEPVEDAHVTFRVEHPETEYGTCTTNFKGYCNINPTINLEPGFYDVTAVATKQGYEPDNTRTLQQTFQVWEQRYTIENLETYEDEFQTKNDTFYRNNAVYASFDIVDDFTGEQITPPSDLVTDVKLKINNIEDEDFDPITVLAEGESLQQVGDEGNFKYKLPQIPITDNFLGDGKVFAFAFNFTDETAGQGSKNVTILNNPLQFNQPTNIELQEGESQTVDFKQYLEDVETPTDLIETTVNVDTIQITDQGQNEYTFTAPQNTEGTYTVTVEADDTDGSTTQQTFHTTVTPEPTGPTASFEFNPQQPTEGEQVTFTSTSSEGTTAIESYEWSIDGETLTGEEVTKTFNEAGTKTATLTVTDQNGFEDTTTQTLQVNEEILPPSASFDFTPETPEVNEQVTFTSTSTDPQGQSLTYAWDLDGDGIIDSEQQNPTFAYDQVGTATVQLRVENEAGLTDTTTQTLRVNEKPRNEGPTANFEFNPENPVNSEDITFTSTSTDADGNIAEWNWFIDGSQVSTQEAFTTSFDTAREYTVRLRVTDNDGAQDAVTQTVTVQEANTAPTASFTIEPQTPNTDEDVTFTSTSTDPEQDSLTHEWVIDGETLTGEEVTKTFNEAGTKTATLTVSDGQLEDTTQQTLRVNQVPTVTLTQTPQQPTSGDDVTVTADIEEDESITSYDWTVEQCTNGTCTEQSFTDINNEEIQFEAQPGAYTVTLNVEDTDGAQAQGRTAFTVDVPNQAPTLNVDVPQNIRTTQQTQLNATFNDPDGFVETIEWTQDGDTVQTEQNPDSPNTYTTTFDEQGVYEFTITVTDNEGLSTTKQVTVNVQDLGRPTARLSIQPNRKEGETVILDGSQSTDPNGEIVEYAWEVTQPDGSTLLTNTTTSDTINPVFPQRGVHTVTLTVTDDMGLTDTTTQQTTIFKEGTNIEPREHDVGLGGWSVKGPQGLGEITLGEPFTVQTSISNYGTERAENLRLSFKLPEFGYERTGQPFNTNSDAGTGKRLTDVMYNVPPGTYPAVVELNGDNIHRKQTLEVRINE